MPVAADDDAAIGRDGRSEAVARAARERDGGSGVAAERDEARAAHEHGRWDFPIGTVMIKIFMFDGKLVETRLLMHTRNMNDSPNGDWVGYGYQWNEAQKLVSQWINALPSTACTQ